MLLRFEQPERDNVFMGQLLASRLVSLGALTVRDSSLGLLLTLTDSSFAKTEAFKAGS